MTMLERTGALIDDRFLLHRLLGRGGMGSVWSARDLMLDRSVAIKFMSQACARDEQARRRFQRESRLACKIRSQHVVQVIEQGEHRGVPYIAMAMLDGEDLGARLAHGPRMDLGEAGEIVEQICRVLTDAHRQGLIHRDIKPSNIFLTPQSDGTVFVTLLDFGVAKDLHAADNVLTLYGQVIGTTAYVSPEQINDAHTVGPSGDVWALAIVIYEMLTGRVPFQALGLRDLIVNITRSEYPRPSLICPDLPAVLDDFFTSALHPEVTARYPSAEALGRAFQHIVSRHASSVRLKEPILRRRRKCARVVIPKADADPDLRPAGVRTIERLGVVLMALGTMLALLVTYWCSM